MSQVQILPRQLHILEFIYLIMQLTARETLVLNRYLGYNITNEEFVINYNGLFTGMSYERIKFLIQGNYPEDTDKELEDFLAVINKLIESM